MFLPSCIFLVTEVYPEGYKIAYFLLALMAVLVVIAYKSKGWFTLTKKNVTRARATLVEDSRTIAFTVSNPTNQIITLSSPTLVIRLAGERKRFRPRGGAFQIFPLTLFPLTTHEFKVDCSKLAPDLAKKPATAWLEIQLSDDKTVKTNRVKF